MQQSVYRQYGAKDVALEVGFQNSRKNKNLYQQYEELKDCRAGRIGH